MRKWNIQFSGARDEYPDTFLTRIEQGRTMISVTDHEILHILPFFLSGIAARWFDGHRDQWFTFREFAAACRERFSDPDFQFELNQEIYRRTQGEHEPVADYLTCMLAMFDRVTPRLSESDEISYAHRNLLLRLHLTIQRSTIRSFAQLEAVAVASEKAFRVARTFRPPPTPERSLLPDLAYRDPKPRTIPKRRELLNIINLEEEDIENEDTFLDELLLADSQNAQSNPKPQANLTSKPTSTNRRQSNPKENTRKTDSQKKKAPIEAIPKTPIDNPQTPTCWNCDKGGHRHNDCQKGKKFFCYSCGYKNVTKPKCPRCTGNEKGNR